MRSKNKLLKPGMLKSYDTGRKIISPVTLLPNKSKTTVKTLAVRHQTKPKKVIGWDLWDDGVNQSFIGKFLQCRYQTHLRYRKLWKSQKCSLPIEFGDYCHWLFSKLYVMQSPPDANGLKKLCKEFHKEWLREHPIPSQKQKEIQERVYGMVAKVMPEYIKRWDGDWSGKYKYGNDTVRPVKWIDLEGYHTRTYTYPDGKKTVLHNIFDGAFYDKKKKLWIFESKTKGRIEEETLQDGILFDTQVMLYLWIAQDVFKEKPAGVLYNVLRRPGQNWLKEDTLKSFCDRVEKDVSKVRRYDHYFKRWEFAIDYSEVLAWKKAFLDPVMQEIRMWQEGKLATYINPFALVSKFGRCDMYAPIVWGDYTKCTQGDRYIRNGVKK